MSPYSRMIFTLLGALLIWLPMALLAIEGSLDFTMAGIYFIGALAISYVGVGVVAHVTNGYAETAKRVEMAKQKIEELERLKEAEDHQRRSTDIPES